MAETIFEVLLRKLDTLTRDINDLKLIEFPVYVDGEGNGIDGRVAEWSDANTITAAKLIGPASNVLTLAAGGAYTLTIPATGTSALGAGTLTASTSNDATGATHTHAITASASPGGSASLLKTTAAGLLTLSALTVSTLTVGSKTLTLTRALTNEGSADGTLSWGGSYTLTIPATGTVALGQGTLTVSTSNSGGSAHTHAITTSSDPGSNARILASTSSGGLTLEALTVGSLTVPTSGTVARGAGTLTVSTSNSASGTDHTHAITSSYNPGAASSILKSSAAGGLNLQDLTVKGFTVPLGAGTLTVSSPNDYTANNHTHAITASSDVTGGSASILKSDSNGYLHVSVLEAGDQLGVNMWPPVQVADIAGACHATSFPTSSDRRLKTNIIPITDTLNKIKQVQPVYFEWNEQYENMGRGVQGEQQIGIIAQEMEAVFPQLVIKWDHPRKYKAIEYGRTVAVVWTAVKELLARVEALEGV